MTYVVFYLYLNSFTLFIIKLLYASKNTAVDFLVDFSIKLTVDNCKCS